MQPTLFRSLLAALFLIFGANAVNATHIIGCDFFYEHVSGLTYKVTLTVYGDCGGPAFGNLQGASPKVVLQNNGITYTTLTLNQLPSGPSTGSGIEVTPVCAAQQNNTTCKNVNNPIIGVTRYIYSVNYTLPYTSANWLFRFDGNMPVGSTNGQAGRSSNITNINNTGGASITVLEARLNNVARANSSPQFNTLPTPFYCANVPQQYNLGATDADKDSLSFALVPGLTTGGTVTYNTGFSGASPLAVTTGSFSFSATTGQMSFTPNGAQVDLVVQQVNEYYNGVLVGTSMREMDFVVLTNCNNTPASNAIDTTKATGVNVNGFIDGPSDFNICNGADSVRFNIIAKNPANDTITASLVGLPPGSTATIINNGSIQPVISFSWIKPNVPPGNYTFYVTYKDNGCPLSSQQTQAYTVHVYQPNEMSTRIAAPTQCVHKALVDYRFSYGLLPRDVTLRDQNGNIIRTFRDTTGTVLDSLGTGTYSVSIFSPKLACSSYYTLQVVDSGVYPNTPQVVSPVFYCKYASPIPLIGVPDSGAVIHWFTPSGLSLNVAPTPRTDTTGIFEWYVDQKFKVCTSLRDTVQVYVTLRPIASIDAPASICLNDTATISFNGSIGVGPILEYHWDFDSAGYAHGEGPGPWRVHWYDTGTKVIHLRVDENKCPSLPVQQTLVVKPIPYAGFNVSDACQYDTIQAAYSTIPAAGQQYAWTFNGADIESATGIGPHKIRYNDSGAKRLTLTVDLNGCKDSRFRDVTVHPAPVASIQNTPASVCIGDRILLIAGGGDSFFWTATDSATRLSYDPLYVVQILAPRTLTVHTSTAWGCTDTANIAFRDVQPCCQFSFPDAFTPNGDQRNDRFHVITYGNQMEFELNIYNRWGQRVYYGSDARQGWDGTYGGKPCDAGVYFYYCAAKCYTGRPEEHKGEVLLVR